MGIWRLLPAGAMFVQNIVRRAVQAPALARAISSTTPKPSNLPAQFLKIKEKQKAWKVDNGLRVHERGSTDKILMAASNILMVAGAVMWVQTVYVMGFPKGLQ